MRLFVALVPPFETRSALAAWRDAVMPAGDWLRLLPAEQLHLTLSFLGDRSEGERDAIEDVLDGLLSGAPAPVCEPSRIVARPRRRPRLFALELEDSSGLIGDLATTVRGGLEEARLLESDDQEFWPHITLARVRGRLNRPPDFPARPPEGFIADRVRLVRSHLSSSGARYETLAEWELLRA